MSYYKKVTLKDIANDSGVSVSSVSMILNKTRRRFFFQ